MLGSIVASFYMLLLTVLFVFIAGIVGNELFAGLFDQLPPTQRPELRFDSVFWSCISVFRILTLDEWHISLKAAVTASSDDWIPFLFYVSVVGIGYFFIHTMFVAIILNQFSRQKENMFIYEVRAHMCCRPFLSFVGPLL